MAGNELMELGRLIVESELDVLYIKDIIVEEAVNEHGYMEIRFLSGKKLTAGDVIRYQGTPIRVATPDGEPVFAGISASITLHGGNDYAEILVRAYTSSILTDREKRTRTFQSEQKTLNDVVREGIGSRALVSVDQDIAISEMLSQEQETDWAFDRRIANQYGKQVFVNGKSAGCHIHIGRLPFRVKELGTSEVVSLNRDVDLVRDIRGNTMPGASVFEFEKTVLRVYDLSLGVGYAVTYRGRQQTVVKSRIYASQGVVWNEVTLANREGNFPGAAQSMKDMGRNSILTGEVLAVEGTMVQVDFHSPEDPPRWIPYASPSSNYFYSMPDPHDTVFVYYETGDSGRIVCMGSRHINDSPDFGNYKNKMLTADNRMIRFSPEEVSLVGNRKEYDGEGGEQAKIVFHDENGIEIYSTQDISIETAGGGSITLQSAKDSYAGLDEVKGTFTQMYTEGEEKYQADGGAVMTDAAAYLAQAEFGHIMENIDANLKAPLQIIETLKELGGRIGGCFAGGEEGEETAPEEAPEFFDGVIDIFALERVTIQVGTSSVTFGGGILQIKSNTYMQLGTDRSIEYEHKELTNYTNRDLFLDITQCALDIIGVLPIPGISTAANLISAGISFARGDYVGAAIAAGTAALSLIPGANTAAAPVTAGKTLTKTQKAINAGKAIFHFAKMLASGAQTADLVLNVGMSGWDIGSAIAHGEFDFDDPDCKQDIAMLIQGASEAGKGKIEKNKARSEREAERGERKESRQKKDADSKKSGLDKIKESARAKLNEYSANKCKGGEPIDMVTGSYLIEQCDFIINDITGIFAVERTYESLLCTEDSPVGRGWTLNLFGRAIVFDDRVEVILPDNHTETFLKTQDGYRNRRGGTRRLYLEDCPDGYKMTEGNTGISRVYDGRGRLLFVEDRNGNRTLYQYKGEKPEKILFASGQYLAMSWDKDKLISMEDCIGRKVRYRYEEDLLTEVRMVNGGVEKYGYDPAGRVMEITDARGVTYVHNEYDEKNRVTRQRLYNGQEYIMLYADAERTNTYLVPANGKEIRYVYNKDRQLTRTEYPDGTAVEYAYDIWENRVYEKDRLGYETHRKFDEAGNLLEERFPDGLIHTFVYDGNGNCIRSGDNTGLESRYSYDGRGNLIKEVQRIDAFREREVSYEYDRYGRILSFTDGNGNRETYGYRGKFREAEYFTTAEGSAYRHVLDRAGRCVAVENADGTSRYGYNAFDILSMETDPTGNTALYEYDRVTDLTQIVRPNHYTVRGGREISESYRYDAFHNRISRTDETGAVFAVRRDGEGNIIREIHPESYHLYREAGEGIDYRYDADDNPCLKSCPDGGKERRWYDAGGNLIKVCLPEQYDETADDGPGFSYEYDRAGRLTQVTGPDGKVRKRYLYDLHGNIRKAISAKGIETGGTDEERVGELYTYNYAGWLTERRIPVRMEGEKALYQLTRYEYDGAGNRTAEIRYLDYQTSESAAGAAHTIRYEYDRDDRPVRVSDSDGAEIRYGYDSQGRRTMESRKADDACIQIFRYFYDKAGRMVKVSRPADRGGCGRERSTIEYGYDANGNVTRILFPSKAEIRREYDAADRLVQETHIDKAGGIRNTTGFAYDRAGNLTCITDSLGRRTQIEYDLMNREVRRTEKDGGVTRQFYDKNGRLSGTIRPAEYEKNRDAGAGEQYTYDEEGRVLTVIRPDGTIRESNVYDADGLLIRTRDATGSEASFAYDLGGRRLEIRTNGQASQRYEYDARGNIVGVEDGEGNRTAYTADAWGRVTEILKADGSRETCRYDHAGNLTAQTDGEGNTTLYDYNSAGELSCITDPMGGKETYAYDEEGRLCRKRDRNGTETRYTYNMYGNLLSRTAGELSDRYEYTPEGLLKSAVSRGMRYSYAYDEMGRLKEKSASGRRLLTFSYDLNGNLTGQEDVTGKVTEYRYDRLDRVAEVWDNGRRIAEYTYYPDDSIKSLLNGESLYTEYAYDNDKNLTMLKTVLGTEVLAENHYRYDGNGNRTQKEQLQGAARGLTSYRYDCLNQLRAVEYPGRKEELFYDRAGNRTGRILDGVEERYRYDQRNRLVSHEKDGMISPFIYDDAGNLLKDDRASYTYDAFNRQTKAEMFDGNIQINRYDAEGLRYEMEENGRLVQFIFRDKEAVAEESEAGTVRYIRTHELLASDAEQARTYYHYASDEMGSITHVTEGEEVLNRYGYDAWGDIVAKEEAVENRFCFAGEQYDPVSQQYYLRARFYNPVIGRFTQEDTYRGDGLNLYAYCQNNPVYYVDPSGHFCIPMAEKILAAISDGTVAGQDMEKLKRYLTEKKKLDAGDKLVAEKLEIGSANNVKLKAGSGANVKGRLPRNNGYWDGTAGNSLWHSDIDAVNKITNGEGIPFVNGRPDFSKWSQGEITFEPGKLSGTQNDFKLVYARIVEISNGAIKSNSAAEKFLRDNRWTAHHYSNTTIQFIPTDLHGNIPHIGSASDMRGGFS